MDAPHANALREGEVGQQAHVLRIYAEEEQATHKDAQTVLRKEKKLAVAHQHGVHDQDCPLQQRGSNAQIWVIVMLAHIAAAQTT